MKPTCIDFLTIPSNIYVGSLSVKLVRFIGTVLTIVLNSITLDKYLRLFCCVNIYHFPFELYIAISINYCILMCVL